MAERGVYVGIDIDDTYAVASFQEDSTTEPATVSMTAGSGIFQIPLVIARKNGIGQWLIGEEAVCVQQEQKGDAADKLLSRALQKEEMIIAGASYSAKELLVLFLKKLISYIGGPFDAVRVLTLAFCIERLDAERIKLLFSLGEQLELKKEQLILLDRKSAFYYFTLNQSKELWRQDVSLFDYRENTVKYMHLKRSQNSIPQLIHIEKKIAELSGINRDEAFYQLLLQLLEGCKISSVYLVGDAFDGDWMKLSLAYLCRGRRAFIGKNLYAKGACYAIRVKKDKWPWPYLYIGDNELKVNVSLAVKNRGVQEFLSLLNAGESWYEAFGSCEVILDNSDEIAVWLQPFDSQTANVEKLRLGDLPERENKTTRLRICAKALSDRAIKIEIKDLGFGEIARCQNKHWEYLISV